MARKFNNKQLIIIFVVLAGLFVVTRMIRTKKAERTLKADLVQIDTSRVDQILLFPRAENQAQITFLKSGNTWRVSKEGIDAPAEPFSVRNIFNELVGLTPERLVATDEIRWPEFQVDDSLGTRIIIKEGKKTTLDLMVGRFNYQPAPQGYGGAYQQNRGRGITYVRLSDEPEVYAVEGFLAMTFNQDFNNWRDQNIVQLNRDQITRLTASYPADSGFVLALSDSVWTVDGTPSDSAATANYVNKLSRKSHNSFVDDFSPVTAPDYELTIEGINMQPVRVQAYRAGNDEFIIHSDLNPESYFRSTKEGVFGELFVSKRELLPPS